MTYIYSDNELKGLAGAYIAPRFFDGETEGGATLVYTSDAKIKTAYEAKGVEVKPISKTGAVKVEEAPQPKAKTEEPVKKD